MSTLCEVSFEPLQCDGANYYSWSAHVLSALRTLGPSYEQVVETSILSKDFDNLSKLLLMRDDHTPSPGASYAKPGLH